MAIAFKKATRSQAKLRLALMGPSGSGKTYTALAIARHLGQRIAVIDTEHGSASKYAGEAADFDVLELDSFSPRTYVDAIRAAEREGYDVIVIDSLSHAWAGKGGALEMVDNAAKKSNSKNTYTAWRDVTPEHNMLVDAIVQCRAHVVATMRTKVEYILEEDSKGKKTPRKIGLAPIQRDGLDYEFDVVADINLEHEFIVQKTRCSALDGQVFRRAGEDVANILKAWLSDGAAPVARAALQTPCDAIIAALSLARDAAGISSARDIAKAEWSKLSQAERAHVKDAAESAEARINEGERMHDNAPSDGAQEEVA